MTVESHCAIVIATLSDWFKNVAPLRWKTKTNHNLGRAIFPVLWASYTELLRIWIGLLHCVYLL